MMFANGTQTGTRAQKRPSFGPTPILVTNIFVLIPGQLIPLGLGSEWALQMTSKAQGWGLVLVRGANVFARRGGGPCSMQEPFS